MRITVTPSDKNTLLIDLIKQQYPNHEFGIKDKRVDIQNFHENSDAYVSIGKPSNSFREGNPILSLYGETFYYTEFLKMYIWVENTNDKVEIIFRDIPDIADYSVMNKKF